MLVPKYQGNSVKKKKKISFQMVFLSFIVFLGLFTCQDVTFL